MWYKCPIGRTTENQEDQMTNEFEQRVANAKAIENEAAKTTEIDWENATREERVRWARSHNQRRAAAKRAKENEAKAAAAEKACTVTGLPEWTWPEWKSAKPGDRFRVNQTGVVGTVVRVVNPDRKLGSGGSRYLVADFETRFGTQRGRIVAPARECTPIGADR
jgi:hypothetical protein